MTLCEYCNKKKVSIQPFTCKCGLNILCVLCRYPETHNCQYDFKMNGRILISKNNPIIINSKIDKF